VKWTGNNSGKHLTYNARSIKCNFDKLKDSSSGVHNWGIDSDVDMYGRGNPWTDHGGVISSNGRSHSEEN
jgi:hypothetical protein